MLQRGYEKEVAAQRLRSKIDAYSDITLRSTCTFQAENS